MKNLGLIIIDLQKEYLPTGKLPLNNIETIADNATKVLVDARKKNIPIIHVRHEFSNGEAPVFIPGTEGVEFQPQLLPADNETIIVKNHINAFRGTDLKQQLDAHGVEELVIVGAMSHMCVDACVRAAVDMGYPVTVLHDACTTLDLDFNGVTVPATQVQAAMMAAFEFGYGTVTSTESYLGTK
ncbi:cysteine hydrolase family protein [Halomonas icarae]|uniref:Isochorismatase family protein n=1 Tax=Halomonas icarae TaxID=2691040 RepID=A0A7X4VXW1_9GAMM|nr:cysteine hydrolase family protein [Halomonas icarae]MDR5902800.1 cysteine hydrolase family protein [Halomonas icarae]NAW12339.1 isochorismatase family protein [Halomonas icarae]